MPSSEESIVMQWLSEMSLGSDSHFYMCQPCCMMWTVKERMITVEENIDENLWSQIAQIIFARTTKISVESSSVSRLRHRQNLVKLQEKSNWKTELRKLHVELLAVSDQTAFNNMRTLGSDSLPNKQYKKIAGKKTLYIYQLHLPTAGLYKIKQSRYP